jgi:hypothetical protein
MSASDSSDGSSETFFVLSSFMACRSAGTDDPGPFARLDGHYKKHTTDGRHRHARRFIKGAELGVEHHAAAAFTDPFGIVSKERAA